MILLVFLLSLTAEDRRRFEDAISKHLASDFVAAERAYQDVLRTHPDFAPARLYRAEALWLLGRKEEARGELEAVREDASELLLFRMLEHTFGERENDSTIVAKLLRAHPLVPNRFLATGTPTLVLLALGEPDEAHADSARASVLDPDDLRMHRQLGTAFAKARLWPPTIATFERVTALDPTDAVAWRQLGSARLVLQRWAAAIDGFERALQSGGEIPGVLLALGYAYERTPDLEAALARYRRAAALAPRWAQPPYRIGRALLASGELDDAQDALEKSNALDPDFPEPLIFLGDIHLKRGETASAIEKLERALAIDSELLEAHYHLAQAYRRVGRDEDARQSIERYAELKRRKRAVASPEEALAEADETRPKRR